MPIRAILFDKDGTLLDYDASWMPANKEVARRAAGGDRSLMVKLLAAGGYDPERDRIMADTPFASGTNREIAAVLGSHLAATDQRSIEALVDETYAEFAGASAVLLPGVVDALTALQAAGYVLGIATNDSEEGLHLTLADTGVLEMMQFAVGYDSGFGGKPAPGMIEGFCKVVDCQPGEVAMVGDSRHDLMTGANAGAGLKVGVLTGPSEHADLHPLADVILPSITELPAYLAPSNRQN